MVWGGVLSDRGAAMPRESTVAKENAKADGAKDQTRMSKQPAKKQKKAPAEPEPNHERVPAPHAEGRARQGLEP